MSHVYQEKLNPFAELKDTVGRYADWRDERDSALKAAAVALTELEIAIATTTSQKKINVAENKY